MLLAVYHLAIRLNRPTNKDGGGGEATSSFKMHEDLPYKSNETRFTFVEVERKPFNTLLVGVTYKPPKTIIETYSKCL